MPARFDLEYAGADGFRHTPVLVHRAVLGSLERFFGILIEHTEGKFPLWLAPVQARVLTITDASRDYARSVVEKLAAAGLRVDSDLRNEKIGYKVRAATLENVAYMLVVGDNEAGSATAALRHRQHGDLGPKPVEEIIAGLRKEAGDRSDGSFWK
jgi:threonyl-tRNA synthetase